MAQASRSTGGKNSSPFISALQENSSASLSHAPLVASADNRQSAPELATPAAALPTPTVTQTPALQARNDATSYSAELHQAIRDDEGGKVKRLLATGLNLNTEEHPPGSPSATPGWSALMSAAHEGHVDIVFQLVRGAKAEDIHRAGPDGKSALEVAAERGHDGVLEVLLEKSPSQDQKDRALTVAAQHGRVSTINLLLQQGAQINSRDACGRTPLFGAIKHPAAIDALLTAGADASLKDADGKTPVQHALQQDDVDVVRSLLRSRARALQCEAGTALMLAARLNDCDAIDYLVRHGESVNESNADGVSALSLAARHDHLQAVQRLLLQGARVDHACAKGNTALLLAASRSQLAIVKLLSKRGAVDQPNQEGNTALLVAAQAGHLLVLQRLLGKGAKTAHANRVGDTALLLAARAGHGKIVQQLLLNDAQVNHANLAGETAIDLAKARQDQAMVDILLAAGAQLKSKDPFLTAQGQRSAATTLDDTAWPWRRNSSTVTATTTSLTALTTLTTNTVASVPALTVPDPWDASAIETDPEGFKEAQTQAFLTLIMNNDDDGVRSLLNKLESLLKHKQKLLSKILQDRRPWPQRSLLITNPNNRSPFSAAVSNNCAGIAELLLRRVEVDWNIRKDFLDDAVRARSLPIAEFLIAWGYIPSKEAWRIAIGDSQRSPNMDMVRLFMQRHATGLNLAELCRWDRDFGVDQLQTLIDAGVNLEGTDEKGLTVLNRILYEGMPSEEPERTRLKLLVQMLIKAGAKPGKSSWNHELWCLQPESTKPLAGAKPWFAASSSSTNSVKNTGKIATDNTTVSSASPEPDWPHAARTMSLIATIASNDEEAVQHLLKRIKLQATEGSPKFEGRMHAVLNGTAPWPTSHLFSVPEPLTPLMAAVIRRSAPMVSLLLAAGADPDLAVAQVSPLAEAVWGEHMPIVRLLAASSSADASFAMWHASSSVDPKPELLQALIEGGANVNCTDDLGRTPLMLIMDSLLPVDADRRATLKHMVRMLIAAGADPHRRDDLGKSYFRREWRV